MKRHLYNLAADKYKGIGQGIIKVFLFFISLVYGLVIRSLILLYSFKQNRLAIKVISVGNITVGGTGKTCLVEYIARYLKQQGHKIAILSRGYKRLSTNYESMGDEPYMLSKKIGDISVIVDANRIRAAKRAIKDPAADTVILDDGFQQWGIIKDLEVVTIDITNPFGNGHMIPRGLLREPLSCLRRADVFVLTKANLGAKPDGVKDILSKINPNALIVQSIHKPVGLYHLGADTLTLGIDQLKGKRLALFCGIGDPDSFENLIIRLGAEISLSFQFPDHHNYTEQDLERIIKGSVDKGIDTIITTEKDAARLHDVRCTLRLGSGQAKYEVRILVLRIELAIIKDEQRFSDRLLGLYSF